MATSPGFLARLGLEDGADERQVRRAYARELKLIDQERDLEGFQHLRACYEAALDWAAHRAARAEPAPAGDVFDAGGPEEPAPTGSSGSAAPAPVHGQADAGPIPAGEEPANPALLGNVVFADFCTRAATLAAQQEQMDGDDVRLIAPWTAALREALADQRLMHLYARVLFEHRVAALLAEGWRPGHHLLLPAAIGVFGWDQDRSTLARLGRAGGLIDAALEQRAMFLSQNAGALTAQREVLSRLRRGWALDKRALRDHSVHLVMLMNHFPTLLGIVAPQEAAAAWRKRFTDQILSSVGPKVAARARPRRTLNVFNIFSIPLRWAIVIAILLLTGVVAMSGKSDADQRERLRHPKEIYQDEPVPAERIEAIRRAIEYVPGKDVPPGRRAAEFEVFLDADGSILGMNRLTMQGDPAYALAVQKAIRANAPFPRKMVKVFKVGFQADAVRVPAAQMAKIMRRIDYRPGKDAPPGEQRVEFQVMLDAAGGIRRMNVVTMSTDPAYAKAVERAIRSVAPFPSETPRSFPIGFHRAKRKPVDGT